ncbi:hypothetical protein AURDEDRAFT_67139 [Auricularia subglabra TFB-10046 SS5]|nr:hypothetical protein AURDEDRAFT_67139 [Auricularia subglabra TFB-10046 SS5]
MTFRSPNVSSSQISYSLLCLNLYYSQDIDIVVETQLDQEELKRRIVQHNPRFFLVVAKTPGATYKVLKHGRRFSRYAVKVDVLIANVTLDIPSVPPPRVQTISTFPACPLAFLILLRLQGWDHHRVAAQTHLRSKAAVDHTDLVMQLLPYVRARIGAGMMADAETYLPARFMDISRARVRRFVAAYPASRSAWETVGAAP